MGNNNTVSVNFLFLVLLILFSLSIQTFADAGPLPVVRPPAARLVMPGSFVTGAFTVSNPGTLAETYSFEVHLPEDWSILSTLKPLTLGPGASGTLLTTIAVPGSAQAQQEYKIKLVAASLSDPGSQAVATFSVRVKRRYAVQVQEEVSNQKVPQGDKARFVFHVVNTGNSQDRFRLRAEPAIDWRVSVSLPEIQLQPGEETAVSMVVHVPKDAASGTLCPVVLKAVSFGAEIEGEVVEALARVWITTLAGAPSELGSVYRQFPAESELWVNYRNGEDFPSLRERFRTGGRLSDERWLDVRYDGRFLQNSEVDVPLQSQWFQVNTGGPGWTLGLGDIYGRFTDLTFLSIPGKGVIADLSKENFMGKIMGVYEQYGDIEKVSAGATLGARFLKYYEIGLNYIFQDENYSDWQFNSLEQTRHLLSAIAVVNPLPLWSISAEFVQSLRDRNGMIEPDYAWEIRTLLERRPHMFIDARYYRAGYDYAGRFRDQEGLEFYGMWQCLRSLQFWSYDRYYWNNIGRQGPDPRVFTGDFQLGTTINLEDLFWTQAYFQYKFDRSKGGYPRNSDEKILSILTMKTFSRYFFSWRIEGRESWDAVQQSSFYRAKSYSLGQVNIGRLQASLIFDLDYLYNTRSYEEALNWKVEGQVICNFFRGRLLTDVRYTHEEWMPLGSLDVEKRQAENIYIRLWYSLSLRNQFRLQVELRDLDFEAFEPQYMVQLIWEFKFRIPVPWERENVRLKGRVFLDEDGSGRINAGEKGLPRVPVTFGKQTILTNDKGNYIFPVTEEGNYPFSVDETVLPTGLVVGSSVPRTVDLARGEVRQLDVPVFEDAGVGGRVFFDRNRDGEYQPSEKGISFVRVLARGQDGAEKESFTDLNGLYAITGIQPGIYDIEVDIDYLPHHHDFTTTGKRSVTIKPDEILQGVDFAVSKKKRTIIKTFGP